MNPRVGSKPRPVVGYMTDTTCWCGCGEAIEQGRWFRPGHDRRASTALIEDEFGSLVNMLLAHGRGPYPAPDWRHHLTAPVTAESKAAVERALQAGPDPMWVNDTYPVGHIGWDKKDARKKGWEWLVPILAAGPRLAWRMPEIETPDPQRAERDTLVEKLGAEHGLDQNSGVMAWAQVRMIAYTQIPSPHDPFDVALGAFEAYGDPDRYIADLETVIANEPRHVDAHVHLGNLDHQEAEYRVKNGEPKRRWMPYIETALAHYQTAVAVAELSMPDDFHGAIPWYNLGNRPYLRAVHGLALAQWSNGQHDLAEQTTRDLLWLNPADNQGARYLLPVIHDKREKTDLDQ